MPGHLDFSFHHRVFSDVRSTKIRNRLGVAANQSYYSGQMSTSIQATWTGQTKWVFFVDLVKAFDTVNREMLMKIRSLYEIPDFLNNVIEFLYQLVT